MAAAQYAVYITIQGVSGDTSGKVPDPTGSTIQDRHFAVWGFATAGAGRVITAITAALMGVTGTKQDVRVPSSSPGRCEPFAFYFYNVSGDGPFQVKITSQDDGGQSNTQYTQVTLQ